MARPSIKYDFSDMLNIAQQLIDNPRNYSAVRAFKNELNHFFKDSKCNDLIITNNTDKMFFGARCFPIIKSEAIPELLYGSEPMRIVEYYIEVDDKLFNPLLDINNREFVAIILHEVGHIINTSEPIEDVRHILDEYCAKNNRTLKIYDSIHYKDLLAFGIKEYISKRESLFGMRDAEVLADEFVRSCGFSHDLESIFDKIAANGLKIHSSEVNPVMTIMWTLDIYKNIAVRRIGASRVLARARSLTASKIEKMEIEKVIKSIDRIDVSLTESSIKDMYKEKIGKMHYNSMRQMEDDYYEYYMRSRNIEDEDDALYVMRSVNTRISIIDDYLSTEKMSETDRVRWGKLLDKYKDLREKLSKQEVYKNKSYGIFVAYPEIRPDRY